MLNATDLLCQKYLKEFCTKKLRFHGKSFHLTYATSEKSQCAIHVFVNNGRIEKPLRQ